MISKTHFTVKRNEIDKMNIVHHCNYPKWFETGRRDFLKKLGLPGSLMNVRGFFLPLAQMECKYRSPARSGDEITVTTRITLVSCVKVKFEYRVLNNINGKLLAVGNTVHVWTNRSMEPVNIEKAAPEIYSFFKESAENMETD